MSSMECPECLRILKYSERLAGRVVNCPNCKKPIRIPETEGIPGKPAQKPPIDKKTDEAPAASGPSPKLLLFVAAFSLLFFVAIAWPIVYLNYLGSPRTQAENELVSNETATAKQTDYTSNAEPITQEELAQEIAAQEVVDSVRRYLEAVEVFANEQLQKRIYLRQKDHIDIDYAGSKSSILGSSEAGALVGIAGVYNGKNLKGLEGRWSYRIEVLIDRNTGEFKIKDVYVNGIKCKPFVPKIGV